MLHCCSLRRYCRIYLFSQLIESLYYGLGRVLNNQNHFSLFVYQKGEKEKNKVKDFMF